MKCKLGDICSYRKGKIDIDCLNNSTYISTENMLPNKGGITEAASLPSAQLTQEYKKGDVLVSNIRPYFKKIWRASCDGGCSNDVLVFQANAGTDEGFLYYVLANDEFFTYSMATSKGTKMPRGDKFSIMQYEVPCFDLKTQRKIVSILGRIDEKIDLNNTINNNLEQQVSLLYSHFFEEIPSDDFKKGYLSEIAEVASGKRPPMRSALCTNETSIPIVGAAAIMGYTNKFNHNDKILVIGRVGTHGIVQRLNTPCWTSDNTLVITSCYYEYLYQLLKRIDYHALNRGSTQPLITQGDINKVPVVIPDGNILTEYETLAGSLMSQYEANVIENAKLAEVRDTLLPKLMSGELDVSDIDL